MTTTTTRITASPEIIHHAASFFSGDHNTILIELVQNARRSGATQVDINYEVLEPDNGYYPTKVTIHDNGPGIFRNGVSITFGNPYGWDETVTQNEDPAGMGLFSLINMKDVTIAANGCSISLDKAAFHGQRDIEIQSSQITSGTEISFVCSINAGFTSRDDRFKVVRNSFQLALNQLQFAPIDISFNGELLERKEYISSADQIAALHFEEWEGLEILVMDSGHSSSKSKDVGSVWSSLRLPNVTDYSRVLAQVNFFGCFAELNKTSNSKIDLLRSNIEPVSVIINVKSNPKLKLELPARNQVNSTDPFTIQLVDRIVEILYKLIEKGDIPHTFTYKTYQELKETYPSLPESRPYLREYGYFSFPQPVKLNNDMLIVGGKSSFLGQFLSDLGFEVYKEDIKYRDYSWYKSIQHWPIEELKLKLVKGDKEYLVSYPTDGDLDKTWDEIDTLCFDYIYLVSPEGREYEVDQYFIESDDSLDETYFYEPGDSNYTHVILFRSSDLISDVVDDYVYRLTDDSNNLSDDYYENPDSIIADIRSELTSLLGQYIKDSDAENFIKEVIETNIEQALQDVRYTIPNGYKVEIKIEGNRLEIKSQKIN